MNPASKHIEKLNSEELEFQVNIAGIKLESPLMNAAGTCKSLEGPEGVKRLVRSATAAIMVGSITLECREGNLGETYWSGEFFSLNSRGLPNPGASYYRQYLPEMVAVAHSSNKPLFVNVAGFTPTEYALLTELAFQGGADLVELNLSCPNIWQEGQQKKIACFDLQLVNEILQCVEEKVGEEAKVAVKLSPFSDPFSLQEVAQVIEQSRLVKAVTAVNTFPNTLAYDERGNPRITPAGGLAGFGGLGLKPIGLGQVKQLKAILSKRINIIGVGGITCGIDIRDYRLAGADALQICTALLDHGPEIFVRLLIEFAETVEQQEV